jgi:hypothetical protein
LLLIARQVGKGQDDERQAWRWGARNGRWDLRVRYRRRLDRYGRRISLGPDPPGHDRNADHGKDARRDYRTLRNYAAAY